MKLGGRSLSLFHTLGILGIIMEWRGRVQDSIKSTEDIIESTLLKFRSVSSMSDLTGPNRTHLGDIGYDGEFKLVSVFFK